MEHHGFIRDILDVKLVILYVMKRVAFPVDSETIYDLCYQDETLSYFDLKEALPQMVTTGHLTLGSDNRYSITAKGREHEEVMEDLVPAPVRERAAHAVAVYNEKRRREEMIRAEVVPLPDGEFAVRMQLDYEHGQLLRLELTAPTEKQANAFASAFRENAETVYQNVLTQMLDFAEKKPAGKN